MLSNNACGAGKVTPNGKRLGPRVDCLDRWLRHVAGTRDKSPRIASWAGGVAVSMAMSLFAIGGARAAETPCPPSTPRHVDLPATRAAVSAGRPITIVAFGSSSTAGAGATAPDRTYPARLEARLKTRLPNTPVTVLNRGSGGQTVEAMLARLDDDVLAVRPTLVIWQAGANEALRGTDPTRFEALLDEGVRRIVAAGSDLVLMDNQVAPRLPPTESQAVFGAVLAREARVRSVSLFSRTALMREWQTAATPAIELPKGETSAEDMIGRDGVHHTDRGYACLAASLGDAIAASTVALTSRR